ncbi:MAG: 50S ribosomal protein L9 [Thiotrichales bacterium]|nr:50S ribosomal protein L9 [Thiotrichales bacterium]|tara:strand:+ start:571 stop:1017 length:447 start_codon:yes stop_codon:yes gene_type:complete
MEVILFETVQNLGRVGDQVKVKPGYARNYLIPQRKAALATPEAVAAVEERRAEFEKEEAAARAQADERAAALSGHAIHLVRKAGDEGKLFGSVGSGDLVEALGEAGFEVTRHEVLMPDGPMRQIGEFEVSLRLHTDVEATIQVTITAE